MIFYTSNTLVSSWLPTEQQFILMVVRSNSQKMFSTEQPSGNGQNQGRFQRFSRVISKQPVVADFCSACMVGSSCRVSSDVATQIFAKVQFCFVVTKKNKNKGHHQISLSSTRSKSQQLTPLFSMLCMLVKPYS